MCLHDVQNKLRTTLNLIHAMSRALSMSIQIDSELSETAAFNCSEMILRAAIELHNDVGAAIDKEKEAHHAEA